MSGGAWMGANLGRQGYCLTAAQRRELRVALRFSTGACLALVVTSLFLQSPLMVFALAAIGAIGGFSIANFCIPSEAFARWERHTSDKEVVTT